MLWFSPLSLRVRSWWSSEVPYSVVLMYLLGVCHCASRCSRLTDLWTASCWVLSQFRWGIMFPACRESFSGRYSLFRSLFISHMCSRVVKWDGKDHDTCWKAICWLRFFPARCQHVLVAGLIGLDVRLMNDLWFSLGKHAVTDSVDPGRIRLNRLFWFFLFYVSYTNAA